MTYARQLVNELVRLGGVPSAPATAASIAATEERLATQFPSELIEFYRLADGLEQATSEWIWDFFPLARITRLNEIRPGGTCLRLPGESESIANKSLIAFCDVLIDAPTYVFGADLNSPSYGHFLLIKAVKGAGMWRARSANLSKSSWQETMKFYSIAVE